MRSVQKKIQKIHNIYFVQTNYFSFLCTLILNNDLKIA